ncbi:FUSC family protein [Streptomyces thinghirensis]|nr:FUSC family protein [Streptomyces thinghirensis]
MVTAAALYQANMTLTWSRAVQRVVGNIAGVLLFAAIAPLAHLGQALLVVPLPRPQPLRCRGADHPQLLARQCLRDPDGAAHHGVRRLPGASVS